MGAAASGEDRLMFSTESADGRTVTIESMRVEYGSAVSEWRAEFDGRYAAFLQSALSI